MTNTPSTTIDRDFYVSDADYGYFELKAVPAGGYAPKKTHFAARVNADGSTIIIDQKVRKQLEDWLVVERFSMMAALAAEEGRYCHGNGADFSFVEDGYLVMLNLVRKDYVRKPLTDPDAANYVAGTRPHREEHTAESLRNHAASKMVMEEI